MLQARGIVGHSVGVAWEVVGVVVVTMLSLVGAAIVAEHGRDPIGRDGTFVHARDSWGVVTASDDGAVADVGLLGEEADLRKLAGLFQVTVCDGSFRVVKGDKVRLNVFWKWLSPDVRESVVVVVDATHSRLGCVGGAQK